MGTVLCKRPGALMLVGASDCTCFPGLRIVPESLLRRLLRVLCSGRPTWTPPWHPGGLLPADSVLQDWLLCTRGLAVVALSQTVFTQGRANSGMLEQP